MIGCKAKARVVYFGLFGESISWSFSSIVEGLWCTGYLIGA